MRALLALAFLGALPGAADPLLDQLDALNARRDEASAQEEADKLVRAALKERPDDYEVLWRAARFHVWSAETSASVSKRKVDAKLGWDYGDRARKANPGRVEGHFYAAGGVGLYGDAHGVMKAISDGVAGKFTERLEKTMAIDAMYDRGGPTLAQARYLYMVPWPMRDLEKSSALLEQVLKKHPENLRARLYLADNKLKDGDARAARALVDQVLAGDEKYDPPEARRVKHLARDAKKRVDDALD